MWILKTRILLRVALLKQAINQDICDTSIILLLGFFCLYVPLLDESFQLVILWSCFPFLAGARLWHLRLSRGASLRVTSFMLRTCAVELVFFGVLHARIWHLNRSRAPLTVKLLKEREMLQEDDGFKDSSEGIEPQTAPKKRRPIEYFPNRPNGDADKIVRSVWERRQRYKAELTGRFLWALHFHFKTDLSAALVLHVLSFLHESERPPMLCSCLYMTYDVSLRNIMLWNTSALGMFRV